MYRYINKYRTKCKNFAKYFSICFQDALSKYRNLLRRLRRAGKCFVDPVLLMLCFAGAIRNGAGIVWAYNIVLYFEEYYPDTNVRTPLFDSVFLHLLQT